jgi:hypothetical protein
MTNENIKRDILDRLIENVERLRYGTASVVLKVHDGNIVAISHEVTETTKERKEILI